MHKPTPSMEHPGIELLACLRNVGITQVELARRMGRPSTQVNRMIKGKIAITAETALQLERCLPRTARYWMDLQTEWDLWNARRLTDG